jgi:hypothetical protein
MKNKILLICFVTFFVLLTAKAFAIGSINVNASITPSTLSSGEDGYVTLTITNVGTVDMWGIFPQLTNIDNSLISKASFPLEGIGGLRAGQTVSAVFAFTVSDNTPNGFYPISFDIRGCGDGCIDVGKDVLVEIENTLTDFEIGLETSQTILSVSVSNVGINSATAVSVRLLPNENFTPKPFIQFLGNLAAGDFTVADFNISSRNGLTNENVGIEISYTDSVGNRHTTVKNGTFSLERIQIIPRSRGPSVYIYVILIVAIAAVTFLVWRKRKKK